MFNKILTITILFLFASCSQNKKQEVFKKITNENKELLSYYDEKVQEKSQWINCIKDSINNFNNSLTDSEWNKIKKNDTYFLNEKTLNGEMDSIILCSVKIADSINKSFDDINLFLKNCSTYNFSASIINDGWLCYYESTSDILLRYSKQLKKLKETVKKHIDFIEESKKKLKKQI